MGYAGAGLGLVGSLMQIGAAIGANKAMGSSYADEIRRQSGYQNQATMALKPQIAGASADVAKQQIGEGSQMRQQEYSKLEQTPLSTPVAHTDSNSSARDAVAARLAGQQRAAIGGYSDWALKQAIQNINTQRALQNASNFARGTAGVFPYRMYDAQHSQDTLQMLGQFISSVGGNMSGIGVSSPGMKGTGAGAPSYIYAGQPSNFDTNWYPQ